MKLLAVATLLALALVALPAGDLSPVDTASANVCRVPDVECHEAKLRCYLAPVLEGEFRACPR